MKAVALSMIGFYRRHLSPLKGFSCAYRAHTGCASCSGLGLRAIRRYGVWQGMGVLRLRMERCGVAHRRYSTERPGPNSQRGFCDCDLPCEGCDLDLAGSVCDCLSGCDLPWKSRKNEGDDESVYIPAKLRSTAPFVPSCSVDSSPPSSPSLASSEAGFSPVKS